MINGSFLDEDYEFDSSSCSSHDDFHSDNGHDHDVDADDLNDSFTTDKDEQEENTDPQPHQIDHFNNDNLQE